MKKLLIVLFVSLFAGQLGGISVVPGVTLYLHDVAVFLIVVQGIFSGAIRRSMAGFHPVRPVGAFALAGIISLLVNIPDVSPDVLWKGLLYLVRWVSYAGVYFAFAGSKFPKTFLLYGLFFLGTGLAIVGLLQFFFYPDLRNLMYLGWDPHYYRVFSTLFDPNYAGILFVLTLIIGSYLLQNKRDRWVIGGIGVNMVALLLTYSRSSYLALLAAIGTWIVLNKKWKVGVIAVLLFLVAVVYLPRPGREALSLDRFDSTASRLSNWSESIRRIAQKPVFGHGFNVLPFLQQETSLPSKAGAGIDNSFLFVGVTTGLVGMIAYGWLLLTLIKIKRNLFFLASFIAILVHSLFVNTLFYPSVMLWMWILTAGI